MQQLLALLGLVAPFVVAALVLLRSHFAGGPTQDEHSRSARQRRKEQREKPSRFPYSG